MPSQLSAESFIAVVQKSGLVEAERLQRLTDEHRADHGNEITADSLAEFLVTRQVLTPWQAEKLLQGKHKGYFLGKYRLLSLLGRGGMSHVYLGEHMLMRRRCAIKVLPVKRVNDSSYLKRFIRESEAVAKLDHPNIVRAYDIDHQTDRENEIHFLVMEYVEGISLQELVAREGPVPFCEAVEWIRQAAQGLAYAHRMGLVHRDIKPGNLLLDRQGVIKILDLGLARFFDQERGDSDALTIQHDERVLGTADYLAPEQALDSHTVDARADIYSLGCTLYFLLTGHPPFTEGTLAQRLMAHQQKEPPPVEGERADLPADLAQIVRKMMAKRPEERYATADEVADVLMEWLTTHADEHWRSKHTFVFGRGETATAAGGGRALGIGSGILAPSERSPSSAVAAARSAPSSSTKTVVRQPPPATTPSSLSPTVAAAAAPVRQEKPVMDAQSPEPQPQSTPPQTAAPSKSGLPPAPPATAKPAGVKLVAKPVQPAQPLGARAQTQEAGRREPVSTAQPAASAPTDMPAAAAPPAPEIAATPEEAPVLEPELASFFAGLSASDTQGPSATAKQKAPVKATQPAANVPAAPPPPASPPPAPAPVFSVVDTVNEFDPQAVAAAEPVVEVEVHGEIQFAEPVPGPVAPTLPQAAALPAESAPPSSGEPPLAETVAYVASEPEPELTVAAAPEPVGQDVPFPLITETPRSVVTKAKRSTRPAAAPPAVQAPAKTRGSFSLKSLSRPVLLASAAVVTVLILVVGGLALGLFSSAERGGKRVTKGKGNSSTAQKKTTEQKDLESARSATTTATAATDWSQKRVAKVGPGGDFRTISEALQTVQRHFRPLLRSDRFLIQVAAGTYGETLSITGPNFPENVVIEAEQGAVLAPSQGNEPVLRVHNVEGFEIRRIGIQAAGRPVAIELSDRLPRCRLQQMTLEGFTRTGIVVRGGVAFSFQDSRLFLQDLTLRGSAEAVGLSIERGQGAGATDTSHVQIERCRFLGPLAAGATLQGADLLDIEFRECIFAKCQVGVKFAEQTGWRECQFVQNTFYQCGYGVLIAEQPPPTQKGLSFRRNLFAETAQTEVFIQQGFDYQKMIDAQMLGPMTGNWTDKPKVDPKELPPGELSLFYNGRSGVENYAFVSTDPAHERFLAPRGDSPHANVGPEQSGDRPWIGALGP